MKNHFITPYIGNKRDEVDIIYENIKPYIDDKKIIIEPFCGSSSISYYISLQQPNKYKYILNDLDKNLIELYKIMKDEDKLKKFIDDINKICFINNEFIDKETYINLIKKDDLYAWYISRKYYNFRQGIYPIEKLRKRILLYYDKIKETPILHFLRTEDIEFKNMEAIDIYEEYKNNEEVFFIMDPPYMMACNYFYDNDKTKKLNIYEYFNYNHTNNNNICFVLENNWIINLLFKNYKRIEYDKKYNGYKRKNVKHIILINDFHK